MRKVFVILLCFLITCNLFAQTIIPVDGGHNGAANKNDGAYLTFPIMTSESDINCITYFVKVQTTTWLVPGAYATETTYTVGNIDKDGNPTSTPKSFLQATDYGYVIFLNFDDFGGDGVIASDKYSFSIEVEDKCTEDVDTRNWGVGDWEYFLQENLTLGGKVTLSISVPDIAANICEGSILDVSTVATVSNADAGGAYSIALTDGGGTNTFNPSYATVSGDVIKIASNCPAGNYTVKATVTDAASNTAETTFSFAVNAKPDITISANPGTTICKGVPLTLSITDAEQVANQYAWDAVGTSTDNNLPSHTTFNPGNATYSAAPTGTMTYQAVAKSAAGCVDTTELLITVNEAPMATLAASSSTVCSGETITLTATVAAGQTADSWKWVNPSSAVTANSLTVTPVNPGSTPSSITYRVKSVKGTCESADYTATVTVNPKPNLSVTAQPVAQCEGNQINLASAILGGATGLTLAYYSDANCTNSTSTSQTVAFADSPKSFWVVGKNATTGCSDTVELKATVNQNPVKPTITGPTEVCEGSTATLTVGAVAGVTYKWYNATGGQVGTGTSYTTPAFTAAASYTVEAEVAGGCKTASDVYNIAINKKPVVVIPQLRMFVPGRISVCRQRCQMVRRLIIIIYGL